MMNMRKTAIGLAVLLLGLGIAGPASAATPSPPSGVLYTAIDDNKTNLSWVTPDATSAYVIYVNGVQARVSAPAGSVIDITLGRILGPKDVVEVAARAVDGALSARVRAVYWQNDYVVIRALTMHFAHDVTSLNADARAKIRAFATLMLRHGFASFKTLGYGSGKPGADGAYLMNRMRAKTAMYAIAKLVPDATHIVSSWGNVWPVTTATTEPGLLADRRVELAVR